MREGRSGGTADVAMVCVIDQYGSRELLWRLCSLQTRLVSEESDVVIRMRVYPFDDALSAMVANAAGLES
jgi:hypothetical protein